MRSIFAGLFILLFASCTFAQTKGEVESIGFSGYYRPDCWTPMVIRLHPGPPGTPGALEPGSYQIQVEQKDLDEDTQVFTRTITISSSEQAKEQRFWMYFLPAPLNGGLPDNSTKELSGEMKVWLCTDTGKQIEPLPITAPIRSVDYSTLRPIGRKFFLCVGDGSSKPLFGDYGQSYGVTEDVAMITVRPDELPESALGFDGVDGVIWMSGDASLLSAAGSRRQAALTEYIHAGGKLIVTQPGDRTRIEALEPLLPIKLKDATGNWLVEERSRTTLSPLKDWVKPRIPQNVKNPWLSPRGTFKIAHIAGVQPGALVTDTIDWSDDPAHPDTTPFTVRWGVGLGQVTWVAQNLGDVTLTAQATTGWVGIWDHVLDLKNDPRLPAKEDQDAIEKVKDLYGEATPIDLGRSLSDAIEHNARGASLVVLAIAFFIIYWLLAGPVGFLFLANKKKKGLSWPIFCASALIATLLTVGVVKLVLGGGADIHHITFVRLAPGQPAVVESRLGVYLTKSSNIPITLDQTDNNFVSYVSAYDPHPVLFQSAGGFVGKERYTLNIPETGSADPVEISVPFRSTLKKIQARWVGELPSVEGLPKLIEATEESPWPLLNGKLTNSTGRDLAGVYFTFKSRLPNGDGFEDRVFYLPKWAKDAQIDLEKDLTTYKLGEPLKYSGNIKGTKPGDGKVIADILSVNDLGWNAFWSDGLRAGSTGGQIDTNYDHDYLRSFPMISLYDRLPAIKRYQGRDRYDLQHRGTRHFDMSPAVAAGNLVIIAQDAANDIDGKTLSTLPFPIEVDHDKIAGTGVTFFQIALPLTRVDPAPTTQPTTRDVEK